MATGNSISENKTLMSEWDYIGNDSLNPSLLSEGSNKSASWICSICNHNWKTSIYHRAIRGTGCPECRHSKRRNYKSKASLCETHPEIVRNWHPAKNNPFTPEMLTKGSRYIAHWRCHYCSHEWRRKINGYTGCKVCKKNKKLQISNLADNHPTLLEEWDFSKNKDISPRFISSSSALSAYWSCKICNHKWKARVSNRAKLGRGCPLCAGKVVVPGVNDLATAAPHLAKEWNVEKNADLSPADVSLGQAKKAWWTCSLGHHYKASILHRGHGTDCPVCYSGRQTSFDEQAVYFYVKQLYPDAINRFKADFLGQMELDIYIPSIKFAIEYDGEAWHNKNTLKREERKYILCQEQGIKLIRLRESLPEINSSIADYMIHAEKLYHGDMLEQVISEVLRRINFSSLWLSSGVFDVNIGRDRYQISAFRGDLKSESLLVKFPDLSTQWNEMKNGQLTPSQFKPGSTVKVWWVCPSCSHDFKASIGHRVNGTGCPKCAIRKVTASKVKSVKMIDPNTREILATFESISDAGRQMNINNSNITMVCKGMRNKAGGYFWVYSD